MLRGGSHHQGADYFLSLIEAEDPERYRRVCERTPVLSAYQQSSIRRRERAVGLLGLQAVSLPVNVATQYGYDVEVDDDQT